jgi:hypothetical protein
MTAKGWKRAFEEPIELPGGRELVTLEDAGTYITELPKAEHEAPEWQAAAQALILVATSGGPTMLARIGMMQAIHRHEPKPGPSTQARQGLQDRAIARRGGLAVIREPN